MGTHNTAEEKKARFAQFANQMGCVVGDSDIPERSHIAVIGPSGSGKTTWASTAKNVMFILTEAQAVSRIKRTNPNAIVQHVGSAKDLRLILDWLTEVVFTPQWDGFKPEWIVLDSVTEMCRMFADALDAHLDGDPWNWGTWKRYRDGCMRMVRRARDLPANIIGCFLDEPVKGSEGSVKGRRLSVGQGSLSPDMASLFNLTFWAIVQERSKDEIAYALRTVGGPYRGEVLEQGKGDEALAKWLNPSEMSPNDVVQAIRDFKRPEVEKTEEKKPATRKAPAKKAPAKKTGTGRAPSRRSTAKKAAS